MTMNASPVRHYGFTLIEVALVALLVGAMGAVVVPQFVSVGSDTKEKAMAANLKTMQNAIDLYAMQHGGVFPAMNGSGSGAAGTYTAFVEQLTQHSNATGKASAVKDGVHTLGPYLRAIPRDPVSGDATVVVVANGDSTTQPTGSSGWFYVASTGRIMQNKAPIPIGRLLNIPYRIDK